MWEHPAEALVQLSQSALHQHQHGHSCPLPTCHLHVGLQHCASAAPPLALNALCSRPQVRETVLRCLKLLPINTMFQNHQEMLKESRLGRHVMLLMKLPDETLENKKRAKELVEAWSRPIFADSQVGACPWGKMCCLHLSMLCAVEAGSGAMTSICHAQCMCAMFLPHTLC